MSHYMRIGILENEIEARLLASILSERHIPHEIRSYYDTAYDGLFQTQKGWGDICGPANHRDEILEILEDIRTDAARKP